MKLRVWLHRAGWSAIVKYKLSTAQPIYAFHEIDFLNCVSVTAHHNTISAYCGKLESKCNLCFKLKTSFSKKKFDEDDDASNAINLM